VNRKHANKSRNVRMSPAQFARDECANLLPGGACLGVRIDSLIDNGQPKTCSPRDRCLVAEGKRCDYFERAILPLADKPSPVDDPNLQAKRAAARQEYQSRHLLRDRNQKRCRDCGNPRPHRRRYCDLCAARRRRETYRRSRAGKSEVRATVTP